MATIPLRTMVGLGALSLLLVQDQGKGGGVGRLDGSGSFYYPAFAQDGDAAVAHTADGPIRASTYLRYLAARLGPSAVEELAFDLLLARECKALGVGRSAPALARGMATRRLVESGRTAADDPDGNVRRKFINEALRSLRVDALVRRDRKVDDAEVRALFERRYGVGGHHVRLRQVLVSLRGERLRLERLGGSPSEGEVVASAEKRAAELRRRYERDRDFAALLRDSDDRATRRMLRDPAKAAAAGVVSGYDQQRYGEPFAAAVVALEVGAVSPPVRTAAGVHLIELLERKMTRFEDRADALRAEMLRGPATVSEVAALRRKLLRKYEFRLVR